MQERDENKNAVFNGSGKKEENKTRFTFYFSFVLYMSLFSRYHITSTQKNTQLTETQCEKQKKNVLKRKEKKQPHTK